MIVDLHDRIQFLNKAAEDLYGWHRDSAIGKTAHELLYTAAAEESFYRIRDQLLEKGSWKGEVHQKNNKGECVIVDARWIVVRVSGEPVAILKVNSDLTRTKIMERQALRGQRLQTLGTVAGGIAHDLNNVLAPISLYAEAMADQPEMAEASDCILECTKRASSLVRDLLGFAQGFEGEREPISITNLIEELIEMLRSTFDSGIEVSAEFEKDLPLVSCNSVQIHQVLLNLCVNARDAMGSSGKLRITCSHDEKNFVIAVKDTGPGIEASILNHIFEPFFTTKGSGRGTGLGLSTSAAIVRKHNGFIEVDTEIGKGTEFRVLLPLED